MELKNLSYNNELMEVESNHRFRLLVYMIINPRMNGFVFFLLLFLLLPFSSRFLLLVVCKHLLFLRFSAAFDTDHSLCLGSREKSGSNQNIAFRKYLRILLMLLVLDLLIQRIVKV